MGRKPPFPTTAVVNIHSLNEIVLVVQAVIALIYGSSAYLLQLTLLLLSVDLNCAIDGHD